MFTNGNFGLKLTSFLRELIHDPSFKIRHRRSSRDFIRSGKLLFPTLITMLMDLRLGSLQCELGNFFKSFFGSQIAERVVSAAALCKARRKICFQAFVEIHQKILNFFLQHGTVNLWRGYRVLAIDGSTMKLFATESLLAHFGRAYSSGNAPCCLARASLLYDALNEIVLDAALAVYTSSEHNLAIDHLMKMGICKNTIFVMDRGYVSFPLWLAFQASGADLCVRLRSNLHLVRQLNLSGKSEMIVNFRSKLNAKQKLFLESHGLEYRSMQLRIIKRVSKNKQPLYLMTTLLDTQAFPAAEIEFLYSLRWKVEEDYKVKKCRLEIENFSGTTPEIIFQDFWSKIVYQNLMVMLRHPVDPFLKEDNLKRELEYKYNNKECLSVMKNSLSLFLLREGGGEIIEALQQVWRKSLSAIRPGRHFFRKNKGRTGVKAQGFYLPYTRIC